MCCHPLRGLELEGQVHTRCLLGTSQIMAGYLDTPALYWGACGRVVRLDGEWCELRVSSSLTPGQYPGTKHLMSNLEQDAVPYLTGRRVYVLVTLVQKCGHPWFQ